ncbi:MAG: hypothetical protein AB4426_07615 [Xenococcaceae cyanobacterium]
MLRSVKSFNPLLLPVAPSRFTSDVIQLIVNRHQLPLIVVDTELEEVRQWIN